MSTWRALFASRGTRRILTPMEEPAHDNAAVTRRAGVVAVGTLSSRLLGAVRDAVIAASFAVGATDVFFVAWTIPNTLRRILGEGAASAAFIPVFSDLRAKVGPEAARAYVAKFAGTMIVILAAVSTLGVVTAPLWAALYGAGYRDDPTQFQTLVMLTQWVFPYIMVAGLSALAMGTLNAMGRFAVPAFAPAMLNLSLIAAPVLFVPVALSMGLPAIAGLAIGALVGGALQLLVQLPALGRVDMRPAPRISFGDANVRRSLSLMAPLLLGTGVHQINILLSRLFASFLPEGSQSFLYYGQRIVEVPQGMFAIAIASAALPSLAALRSRQQHAEAAETFRYSLRLSLFVAIPATVAIAILATPIVSVLFGRGAFVGEQVTQTARCLVWMAAGVWAVAAIHPVVRMYHAYGDTRTPVLCSAINLACFVACSVAFMGSHGHVAIAAASTLAAFIQLLALLLGLSRRIGPPQLGEVVSSASRHVLAAAVMGGALWVVSPLFSWERGGNDPVNIGGLLLLVVLGAGVYAGAARLLRVEELQSLLASLKRRTKRTNATTP